MFTPYKGRQLDLTKAVQVYRNLHNGMLSIRQGGVVVGHATHINLKQVSFKVNEKARQRVLREKKKYVHAFVLGKVVDFEPTGSPINYRVKVIYNPYKFSSFVWQDNEKPIGKISDTAIISITHTGDMHFPQFFK